MEIERRSLARELPVTELRNAIAEEIQQGYLIRETDREVRIRSKGEFSYLAEKKGSGLSREEHEILINVNIFNALWPMTDGMQRLKARSTFMLDGHELELDVYHGALQTLMTLETEFLTEEQALAWSPPWFAGSEVPGDKRYKNAQLAKTGNPDNG